LEGFLGGSNYVITPVEFENEHFTLKTHQMFSVHITAKEFKRATNTGHFGFVFEENSVREKNLMIIVTGDPIVFGELRLRDGLA